MSLGRPLTLITILAVLLSGWSQMASPTTAQTEQGNFLFDETTSQEDGDLIREGVRLAHDFLAEEFDIDIDPRVHVTTRPGADEESASLLAFSMGRSIVVYTGSPVWQQSSPVEKLMTVVHEYAHYYQYIRAGSVQLQSTAWIDEGFAEFLALAALDQREIADRESMEAWFASLVMMFAPDVSLSTLESHDQFRALGTISYPLAYFAVKGLLQETGNAAIDKYYGLLESGAGRDLAFSASFGISPRRYEPEFAKGLASLTGSLTLPPETFVREGAALTSPVRIVEAPESVQVGDQILIRARTVEASICSLFLQGAGAVIAAERHTFADGDGDVFWLVTIPAGLSGDVLLTLDCGLEPIERTIDVAAYAVG